MKRIFLCFVLLLIGLISYAAHAAVPEAEYITPAEPVTSLRSSLVPCYSGYRGIGRNVAGREIAGEECPKQTSSLPRRTDRPETDTELDSPGMPFPKRME
jgi:hypothetical protein